MFRVEGLRASGFQGLRVLGVLGVEGLGVLGVLGFRGVRGVWVEALGVRRAEHGSTDTGFRSAHYSGCVT